MFSKVAISVNFNNKKRVQLIKLSSKRKKIFFKIIIKKSQIKNKWKMISWILKIMIEIMIEKILLSLTFTMLIRNKGLIFINF